MRLRKWLSMTMPTQWLSSKPQKMNMNRMQATETQQLQASQEVLTKLEQLSDSQGSGQLTLFFGEGSEVDQEQQQRCIQFLDGHCARQPGPQGDLGFSWSALVLGVVVNLELSIMRSMSPLYVIEQYLVNTPHEFQVSLWAR